MAEIRPNGTDRVKLYSIDLDASAEFGLNEEDAPKEQWARYVFGVCREIIKRGGKVEGFDAVFSGNVPLGATCRRRLLWRAALRLRSTICSTTISSTAWSYLVSVKARSTTIAA